MAWQSQGRNQNGKKERNEEMLAEGDLTRGMNGLWGGHSIYRRY